MLKKILLGLAAFIGLALVAFAVFVATRQHLQFNDTPYPDVAASADTTVIARGRYVVRDLANCANCHGDPSQKAAIAASEDVPLSGGGKFEVPPGVFYTRNITPDSLSGLGAVSDRAIARALRNGVGHDGRALLPFMEFQNFSDEDLVAVVSYLRSQKPVRNVVPMHHYNLLGKIVRATMLSQPVGPHGTPPVASPRGATVENGRYLVESVALCGSCHTQRNMMTGAFTGPHLGGSTGFEKESNGHSWSPPNITSDPTTGRAGMMNEDGFVARFRAGRIYQGSPMPWEGFRRLSDDDLRAIYRYLKTVPPAHRDVGPPEVVAK
ncbi:MAG TPA: c-type cytochrome [Candidatus Krumholzibacteria bacterium]|nr:c-type cytochrome [Candidatus Krumholzibacteria bacterium]